MFRNIPDEIKIYQQFVMWRYEDKNAKKPTKVPYSARTGKLASVTDYVTWSTFEECLNCLNSNLYDGIGFVLTENDPYTVIDLDDTKGDTASLDRQMHIFSEFESYAERSISGTGLHIWIKGSVPSGRRRSCIEVYSSQRYMVMTGDVYRKLPIKDYNGALYALWEQMSEGKNADIFYAGLEHAKLTDDEVLNLANTAANSEKFRDLYYDANWQKYYPSQSEADFAIFDIIAFYSENGQQTQRIYLKSKLAEREKSRAQYRINYMLNRCFDRMLPPVDIDGLKNKINEVINKKEKETKIKAEVENKHIPETDSIYSVPPGLVGEIAQFIYAQAPTPVAEIALAGAIGFVAGIVGRSYNILSTGLNQYVLLLANTGVGKEAIAKGIDKLVEQVIKTVPAAIDFIGPAEISSSQAVVKYMSKGPTSFVSMVGEFGLYLQQMGGVNAAPHLVGLRRFLLNAYNKSGEGQVLRPHIWSEKEKNTAAILSPALSILGESTPEKFYEGLHEGLITEGLLPRFTMIEYYGEMPKLNKEHGSVRPNFQVIDKLASLCAHSLMLNSQNKCIQVVLEETVVALSDNLAEHCRTNANSSDRDIQKQLWTRVHMKTLKLAGVVAVGCNPYNPVVDINIFKWSEKIVLADTRNLLNRFNRGEIGIDNDETKQLIKIVQAIKDFVVSPWPMVEKYAGEGASILHSNRIVPYSYIQRKLAAVSVFKKDRQGSTMALKRGIKTLCERGDLQEINRATLSKEYHTTAVAYAITHISTFGL